MNESPEEFTFLEPSGLSMKQIKHSDRQKDVQCDLDGLLVVARDLLCWAPNASTRSTEG